MGSIAETWPRLMQPLDCTSELRASSILPHQQPCKCQSVMMEDSENSKWQDWRLLPPLTQLGWFSLWTLPVQLLLTIRLIMISQTWQDDRRRSISVGASVPVWVIRDICEREPESRLENQTCFSMNESFVYAATTQAVICSFLSFAWLQF